MITLKEEFVDSDKWRRAIRLGGDAAIVLWLCIKAHAAKHLTNGFISQEDLATLPGAPSKRAKALEALLTCGRMNPDGKRGAGLLDVVANGYQLHDYLEHAESRDRILERRQLAADRKRKQRTPGAVTEPVPLPVTQSVPRDTVPALATRPASVPRGRADVPSPAQSGSYPAEPDQAAAVDPKDLTGSAQPKPGESSGGGNGTRLNQAAEAAPRNFEEAMAFPICVRAVFAQQDEHRRDFLEPQRWPEVLAVAAALAEAAGGRSMPLSPPSRDAGVRAVLTLYAAGWVPRDVERVARQLPREPGWAADGKRRGLSWLTPEVARRALAAADDFDTRADRSRRAREQTREDAAQPAGERVSADAVEGLLKTFGAGPARPPSPARSGPMSVADLDAALEAKAGTP